MANQVTVNQNTTRVVTVKTLGPRGPQGVAGPSGSAANTGSLLQSSQTGSLNSTTVTGSFFVTGSVSMNALIDLAHVSQSLDFPGDVEAAAGGVPLGGVYRSGNVLAIRIS